MRAHDGTGDVAWGITAYGPAGSCDVAGQLAWLGYRPIVCAGLKGVGGCWQSCWLSDQTDDIFGQRKANPRNMRQAVLLAVRSALGLPTP